MTGFLTPTRLLPAGASLAQADPPKVYRQSKKAILVDAERASAIRNDIMMAIDASRAASREYLRQVQEMRHLYDDVQRRNNPPWPDACELRMPFLDQSLLNLASHLIPAILDPKPLYHVEGQNASSKLDADDMEQMQQATVTTMGLEAKLEALIFGPLRDGIGYAEVTWVTRTGSHLRHQMVSAEVVDPETLEQIAAAGSTQMVETDEMEYDAPVVDMVPIEHAGTFPTYNVPVDESPGFYRDRWVLGEDLLRWARDGDIDKGALESISNHPGDDPPKTADDRTKGIEQSTAPTLPFRARLFHLTEVYYRMDRKGRDWRADAPGTMEDGFSLDAGIDWHMYIHEPTTTVLEMRHTRVMTRKRPYIAVVPYYGIEGVAGKGLATTGAGQFQMAMTTAIRMYFDGMRKQLQPPMYVDDSITPDALERVRDENRPGGIILVPAAILESGKHIVYDQAPINFATVLPFIELMLAQGQESTGTNAQDAKTGSNLTATEAMQMAEMSQKVLGLLVKHFQRAFNEIGRWIFDLSYQYQGNEGSCKRWDTLFPPEEDATAPAQQILQGMPATSPAFPMQPGTGASMPQLPGGPVPSAGMMAPAAGTPSAPPKHDKFRAFNGAYTITCASVGDTQNRMIKMQQAKDVYALLSNIPWIPPDCQYANLEALVQSMGVNTAERRIGTLQDMLQGMTLINQLKMAQANIAQLQGKLDAIETRAAHAEATDAVHGLHKAQTQAAHAQAQQGAPPPNAPPQGGY